MHIPPAALPYILFQRTEICRKRLLFLSRLARRFPLLCRPLVYCKAILYAEEIRNAFAADMQSEYEIIQPFLPITARKLLDIGCGVGGIDVFLSWHYNHAVHMFLLDKTAIDTRVYYKFKERGGSVYNSLTVARDLLVLNGVNPERIQVQEVNDDNAILFDARFDLVVSLMSWGFHYPVSTYLESVFERLNSPGSLIIDVRKHTGGEELVRKIFGNAAVVFETSKMVRLSAVKRFS